MITKKLIIYYYLIADIHRNMESLMPFLRSNNMEAITFCLIVKHCTHFSWCNTQYLLCSPVSEERDASNSPSQRQMAVH